MDGEGAPAVGLLSNTVNEADAQPNGLNTLTGEPRRWTKRIGPAYHITSDCIACAACVRACPFDAIVQDGFDFYVVAEECPGCAKCVPVCPVDTIRPDPNWRGVIEVERAPAKNPWRT